MTKFKKALLGSVAPLLLSSMLGMATATQAVASDERFYGRFTADNELYTPRNHREWVFIGASVTPNDMNDGAAAFPEFHNVYIDPGSYAHWKKTGEFRSGTVIVKELASVGTKEAPSGNGYFQGEYGGIAAMVKNDKRYPDRPGNWAYFGFDGESRHGAIQEDSACSACHQQNAADDQVFTQFYPVLRAAKP
jgi:cytochrome P460